MNEKYKGPMYNLCCTLARVSSVLESTQFTLKHHFWLDK